VGPAAVKAAAAGPRRTPGVSHPGNTAGACGGGWRRRPPR